MFYTGRPKVTRPMGFSEYAVGQRLQLVRDGAPSPSAPCRSRRWAGRHIAGRSTMAASSDAFRRDRRRSASSSAGAAVTVGFGADFQIHVHVVGGGDLAVEPAGQGYLSRKGGNVSAELVGRRGAGAELLKRSARAPRRAATSGTSTSASSTACRTRRSSSTALADPPLDVDVDGEVRAPASGRPSSPRAPSRTKSGKNGARRAQALPLERHRLRRACRLKTSVTVTQNEIVAVARARPARLRTTCRWPAPCCCSALALRLLSRSPGGNHDP